MMCGARLYSFQEHVDKAVDGLGLAETVGWVCFVKNGQLHRVMADQGDKCQGGQRRVLRAEDAVLHAGFEIAAEPGKERSNVTVVEKLVKFVILQCAEQQEADEVRVRFVPVDDGLRESRQERADIGGGRRWGWQTLGDD